MASKQTEHYKLSQWEATDSVLRHDFNDDNGKIDAALHGLVESKAEKTALAAEEQARVADTAALRAENLWVKVAEKTFGSAAATQNIVVPNAGQYQHLLFSYSAPATTGTMKVVWNGAEICTLMSRTDTSGRMIGRVDFTAVQGGGTLLVYDTYWKGSSTNAVSDGHTYSEGSTFSGDVKIGLRGVSGNISAGAYFVVYGMKK